LVRELIISLAQQRGGANAWQRHGELEAHRRSCSSRREMCLLLGRWEAASSTRLLRAPFFILSRCAQASGCCCDCCRRGCYGCLPPPPRPPRRRRRCMVTVRRCTAVEKGRGPCSEAAARRWLRGGGRRNLRSCRSAVQHRAGAEHGGRGGGRWHAVCQALFGGWRSRVSARAERAWSEFWAESSGEGQSGALSNRSEGHRRRRCLS
jgi:hypothetical protein